MKANEINYPILLRINMWRTMVALHLKLQFPSRRESLILPKNYNNKLKLKSKIDKKRKKH